MMALHNIISQSNKPLRISIGFGFLMALASFIYAGYRVYIYLRWGVPIPGWTSVIVSIYFIGGLLFANLGVLGLYLGKVFDEAKRRPLFVVRERTWSESRPATTGVATADVRPIKPETSSRDSQTYRSS
jgi:dolichol-phosphate mannosyltransferase